MEVKIGIANTAREIVIEVNESSEQITASLKDALAVGDLWQIADEKGRRVVVPVAQLGYVDLGAESVRRVGFGSV